MDDGHAIVANLGDIFSGDGHCVMIYALENQNFKIKDSHGVKYEIPIDRPDFYQVNTSFDTILTLFVTYYSGPGNESYQ